MSKLIDNMILIDLCIARIDVVLEDGSELDAKNSRLLFLGLLIRVFYLFIYFIWLSIDLSIYLPIFCPILERNDIKPNYI